jgi:hypothetical protein
MLCSGLFYSSLPRKRPISHLGNTVAKVGVVGSNPIARSNIIKHLTRFRIGAVCGCSAELPQNYPVDSLGWFFGSGRKSPECGA